MNGALTSDYAFELPAELIAQQPLAERSDSRLMLVHRADGRIEHRKFTDLVDLIDPRDMLVRNTSRVLKARLLGKRDNGGDAEVLLLKPASDGTWEAMVSPGGKLKPGRRVAIAPGFTIEILETTERRTRRVRLDTALPVADALERFGHVPLPPYITRPDSASDIERYQTVYAREAGSIAAPTAGLHFTDALLGEMARRGVAQADVVLHVGAGTFKPVDVDDPAEHVMHEEWYSVPRETEVAVDATRGRAGRVWAVGTTTARTLESAARDNRGVQSGSGETRLFVRPPYRFRVVDALITNFHLPRSTLLMLVAAFAGYDLTMAAYREAVQQKYRFYSYGDAMVVLP
ncbi:MAG: tRNA preQ1(34) S-adenosylmethionine ribosyltransferase-isomerase QueA [Gemmatimonadota bacterium]